VIVPSRDRELLERLVDTLWARARGDQWHIYVGLDVRDHRKELPQTKYVQLPKHMYFRSVSDPAKTLFRPSSAINWLARNAPIATHYWALNDDAVVLTPGWDERIMELPQGWLGMSDYSPAGGWHSNFPVFTLRHLETFRTLFHPRHWGWVADQWISKAYTIAERALPLGIHILHHQADQARQQAIYHHQPDDPDVSEQLRWAKIISATAQKKTGQHVLTGPFEAPQLTPPN
jgi:hypothetical protein